MIFPYILIAVVLWYGGLKVQQGKLSVGELSSFIFMSIQTGFSAVSIGPGLTQL